MCQANSKEAANEALVAMGASPLSSHGLHRVDRSAYAIKKIQAATSMISDSIQNALGLEVEPLPSDTLQQDSSDLHRLMTMIKGKLTSYCNTERIKLLSLVPLSWSIRRVESFFDVSQRCVRRARELLASQGILPEIEDRRGKSHQISEDTKIKVSNLLSSLLNYSMYFLIPKYLKK